ncbi:MAG TPA: choice-of-anchor D domain-containing protein [Candidatus Tumulicola sp.]|nr:choice-of-anchor D domain-containing protein [Candidatus Tumulicola sp.]
MPRVVVAGSENDTSFAVIDFTNPNAPSVKLVDPGFASGCHVTINGNNAVAGSVLTSKVRLVDVSNPAVPALRGTIATPLNGIGAIAMRGSRVAVGEFVNNFKARVSLLDFSNPNAPTVIGTAATPLASNPNTAVGSIAFLSDNVVVASGPSDFEIVQVDFSNPMAPVVTNFNPVLAGPPVIDSDSAVIAAGDSTSGILKLFDVNKALIASVNTMLPGITSVAVSNPLVLAASANSFNSDKVDFGGPSVSSFNPNLAGGSTTAIEGKTGACGAILGSSVALVDLTGAPAVLGTANAAVASISTLAISTFAGPGGPQVTVNPLALVFGAVKVNTLQSLMFTIHNAGGGNLNINNLHSSDPRFTFSPGGPFNLAGGGNQVVTITFKPTAEAPFSGNLIFSTNDLAHPTVTVPLSGVGGLPHISVSPLNLDLGSVAVCLSGSLPVNIKNTGAVPLTVSSVTTSGPPFSAAPGNLVVNAGATAPVTAKFTPSAIGPAAGTLTITSDDQTNPAVNVALNGTGLPTPPPAIAVSPNPINFGATPVQFYIGRRITIANTSPCQSLFVTLTSNGAPFFVTDVDPTTLPPASLTVSGSVPANASKRFVVVFAPTVLGASNGTLAITSNDPINPKVNVPLSGMGVQLNPASVELVLDRSGSMSAPAQGGTKMDGLKAAVHLFADLMIPGQGDEMGSVEFDDAVNVLTPFGSYDTPKRDAIKNDADTLTPRHLTSIGGGLHTGQAQVVAGTTGRKVILVFTDGMENTPPMIATEEPPILAAGTEVYAIGLGQPQNISAAALSMLAASSNGNFFQTDDTLILRKHFVQVLADAFRQNMAQDPVFAIAQGATKKIPVSITQCERRITFVLNWDDAGSQVDLNVRAPDGTLFTPNSPNQNQLVRYGDFPGYRYYQIAFPPLDPGSGLTIGPSQLGQWVMEVRGSALAGASERCTTSVVVESQLELRGIVHAVDIGQPIQIEATITDHGLPVTTAELVVTLTAPQKSLAAVSTPPVILKALDADKHPIPAGKIPLIPVKKTKYRMKPGKESRPFTLTLPAPRLDGVYQFEFQAKGQACGGAFDRYREFSLYIGRKAHDRRTGLTVESSGPTSAVVTVTPRDSRGEPLGPGLASLLRPGLKGGTVFPVVDRRDGSYAFRASWPGKRPPTLNLKLGDKMLSVPLAPKQKR